jgi:hypothetical protein
MSQKSTRFVVWAGRYSPAKFSPHDWTQNPPSVVALMPLCDPSDLRLAQEIANGFNVAEIKALASIDAARLKPSRNWAFIVSDRQAVVAGKLYRIVSSDEPSVRLAGSEN